LFSLLSAKVTGQNLGLTAISMGKPSITLASGTDKDFDLLNQCPSMLNPGQLWTITPLSRQKKRRLRSFLRF
jgi:hypothetical protein